MCQPFWVCKKLCVGETQNDEDAEDQLNALINGGAQQSTMANNGEAPV